MCDTHWCQDIWEYFILYHSPNDPLIYRHFLLILSHIPGASYSNIRTVSNILLWAPRSSVWADPCLCNAPRHDTESGPDPGGDSQGWDQGQAQVQAGRSLDWPGLVPLSLPLNSRPKLWSISKMFKAPAVNIIMLPRLKTLSSQQKKKSQ